MITKENAQLIAGWWHAGQWSALYSFSSSGHIDAPTIADEIRNCLIGNTSEKQLKELLQLSLYLLSASVQEEEE